MEIKIKIGNLEIEFEGEDEFLRDELKRLVSSISGHFEDNLKKRNKIKREKAEAEQKKFVEKEEAKQVKAAPLTVVHVEEAPPEARAKRMSTGDIADKIGCKSGADLIIAAAAKFTFYMEKETYTLQELLEQMKEANGYFTKNYNINIGQYLMLLVKERKIKKMGDAGYRLRSAEKARLEQILFN